MENALNKLEINYQSSINNSIISSSSLYFALLKCYFTHRAKTKNSNFFSLDVNSQLILFSRDIFNAPNIQNHLYSFLLKDITKPNHLIKIQNAPNSCFEISYNKTTQNINLAYITNTLINPSNLNTTCSFIEMSAQIMNFISHIVYIDSLSSNPNEPIQINVRNIISYNVNVLSPFTTHTKNRFELMLFDSNIFFNPIHFMEITQSIMTICLFNANHKPIRILSYIENAKYCIEFIIKTKQKYTEINLPTYFRDILKINQSSLSASSTKNELILKLILPYENTHS